MASGTGKQVELVTIIDASAWSARQKAALLLICIILLFDGLDNLIIGVAAPAIARDLGVALGAFGTVFALGLVGLGIGSMVSGPLADRFGRKTVLLACVLIFGSCTFALAFAQSITALSTLRLFAGLGLGGAVPSATTLTAEITPGRTRTLAVTLAICSIPFGAVVGSALAAEALPQWGWRWLIGAAGLGPVLILPVLLILLPESPQFMITARKLPQKIAATLAKLGISVPDGTEIIHRTEDVARANPAELFRHGRARDSIALCGAFAASTMSTYLIMNWLPSVLTVGGLDLRTASRSMMIYSAVGIASALLIAAFISRFGSRIVIPVSFGAGVLSFIFAFGPPAGQLDHFVLLALVAVLGAFITASNAPLFALASQSFPTEIRATGVATALVCGRIGGVASAILGGLTIGISNGARAFFIINAVACIVTGASLMMFRRHLKPTGARS